MVKLINVDPNLPVYKYFQLKWLKNILEEKKMSFKRVLSWASNDGDSFEALFSRQRLKSDGNEVLKVSDFCSYLYGQSWTSLPDTFEMWCNLSDLMKLENVAVMVRTRVSSLMSVMDDSIKHYGHSISFNDRLIGKVEYLQQNQIDEWFLSLGSFHAEDVANYQIQYALMKRRSFEYENEIRCLAWEADKKEDILSFDILPNMFDEFVLDPRLTAEESQKVCLILRDLGISRMKIKQSSLASSSFC